MSSNRNLRMAQEAAEKNEPFFVIRAQDRFSVQAIQEYFDITYGNVTDDFSDAVVEVLKEFDEWQLAHPDRVETPDLREGE